MLILISCLEYLTVLAKENLSIDEINVASNDILILCAFKSFAVFLSARLRAIPQLPRGVVTVSVEIITEGRLCLPSTGADT